VTAPTAAMRASSSQVYCTDTSGSRVPWAR
jgi:hypothetical protein